MSNRKDRRRAAAARRAAKPLTRTDRNQLYTRVALVIGAAIAAVLIMWFVIPRGL